MSKYRVAIVGCGKRSRPHIQAYTGIDNAVVVACCAPTASHRDQLAAEFGLRAYADARIMIEQERPDIVHLVTWPDTRVELMTIVSESRVPLCTIEKPIATEVADWKAICELAGKTVTKFAVCHQFRWQMHLVKCQTALKSGKLGGVKFLDMSAGKNIADQGTHILNYGRSLIGDALVKRVAGNAYGWEDHDVVHPAPATTEAYLTFENGVRGLWTSGSLSPRCGDPEIDWQHVRVAAYAERGRVNYEEFGRWEVVSLEEVEEGNYGGMEIWRQNNLGAQTEFHRAMFAWLTDNSQMPGTSLKQSLHEWKVVLALYTSALESRPIEMDVFEPDDHLFQNLARKLQNYS